MAVLRQSNVNVRFVGLSTDAKPSAAGDETGAAFDPGATFWEWDTDRHFTWIGTAWVETEPANEEQIAPQLRIHNSLLEEILMEIRKLRLGMIEANDPVCTDIEGDLTPSLTTEE